MTTDPGSELASLSEKGSAPKTRISSAQQVRDIYKNALRDGETRSRQNALVKGLVDGNPPYEQAKLDASGQRYRANFNNGEAEAFTNTAKDAFYDLFSEVPTHATITYEGDEPEAVEWGECMTRHFDWLQRQDESFDFNIQVSQHDMVLYGMGPMIWEDDYDWRSKRVAATNIYLPGKALAQCTEWPWVMIYRELAVDDLYRFISDEDTARTRGWKPAAVKKAIIESADRGSYDWQKWETWQQAFRDGDLHTGETHKMVKIVQILFREFSRDGAEPKISECWVSVDSTSSDEDTYLFHQTDRYEDMKQAICPFFYDRGDGSAHGVRGLGRKMQKLLLAKMRLQNATVDAAFARAAIMLKSLGNQNQSTMSPVSLGPYTIMPQGYEVIQGLQAAGVIDAPLAVQRDLDMTLTSNLGQYKQRMDKPDGNPRTATEVASSLHQSSALAKTQIARYYEQLDDWYAERFRRASNHDLPSGSKCKGIKLALEFQKRCKDQGVPKKAWDWDKVKVKATRTVGQGSAIMRIGMLNQILATLGGMLPEDGRQRLTRDLVAAQAGQDMVPRYLPAPAARTYEAGQRWEAQMENGILKQGGNVTITPLQSDVVHLQEHISFASQAAASLPQGAPINEVWVAMDATGRHSAMHLQRLSQNPQRQAEFKAIYKQFQQLAAITDQIREKAESEQPAQDQNGAPSEAELKAAKTAADLKLKSDKQNATLTMKAQSQGFNQRLASEKFAFDKSMKDAQTAAAIAGNGKSDDED